MIAVLKQRFSELYADGSDLVLWSDCDIKTSDYSAAEERQQTDEWIYGATPSFSVEHDGEQFEIVKGAVASGDNAGKLFKQLANSMFC